VEKAKSSAQPEKDLSLESLKESLRKIEDVQRKVDEKLKKKKFQGVSNKEKSKTR
jgi:hypothetical protein